MAKKKFIDKVEGFDDIPPEHERYYVVLRSGRRVSSDNHHTYDSADAEKQYWVNILYQYPDGTRMEIVTCKNPNYKLKT